MNHWSLVLNIVSLAPENNSYNSYNGHIFMRSWIRAWGWFGHDCLHNLKQKPHVAWDFVFLFPIAKEQHN